MTETSKIYGWRSNIAWDRIQLNSSGRLLVETQGGDSITNYNLETTQLSVLSNINSIKNNSSDIAINTLGISNDTININSNVNIMKDDIKSLKKDDINYINYELSVIGSTLWADSVNPYIKDPTFNRDGWYYVNSPNVGGSNVYWYSSDAPYSFRGNSNLSLLNLTIDGGFYVVMYIDKVSTTNQLPIFAIYTTPTGTGDAVPGFYKSRLVYIPSPSEKLYNGELVILYNHGPILSKIKNIYPNARRVQLSLVETNGEALSFENIRFMSINGNSGSPLNTQQWLINSAGWYDGVNSVVNYKFTVEAETTNITNYALETTLLDVSSNVNSIKFNTSETSINTLSIGNDTSNIDSKLTFGHIEDIPDALQTAIYARHKNTHIEELGALNITTGHNLCISIQDLEGVEGQKSMVLSMPVVLASDQTDINTRNNSVLNLGSYNNVNNDTTILAGGVSTLTADITNMRDCNIVYTDSSTGVFDSVGVEVSGDGVNYHEVSGIFPSTSIGDTVRRGFTPLTVGGFTLLRIRNKSSDNAFNNVMCSVYGSP